MLSIGTKKAKKNMRRIKKQKREDWERRETLEKMVVGGNICSSGFRDTGSFYSPTRNAV